MVRDTIKGLAEKAGVPYADAQGLMRYLAAKGIAKEAGSSRVPGKKGKGSTIWEMPDTIVLEMPLELVKAVVVKSEEEGLQKSAAEEIVLARVQQQDAPVDDLAASYVPPQETAVA